MDINDKVNMEKEASLTGIMKLLGLAGGMTSDAMKSYLTAAAALGVAGGAGIGLAASNIKKKNKDIESMNRRKKFYDNKVQEMENENWLNDVMAAKRKLETSKMTPEERSALEKEYIKLLNR